MSAKPGRRRCCRRGPQRLHAEISTRLESPGHLSSYLYRLVFNDNFSQAISSQVASDVGVTYNRNGTRRSRSTALRPLPARPTATRPASFTCPACALTCSIERCFPHLSTGDSALPSATSAAPSRASMRATLAASTSIPTSRFLSTSTAGASFPPPPFVTPRTPSARHPISLIFGTASPPSTTRASAASTSKAFDIRPPALERDFILSRWNRVVRHVIEPELTYRYVAGIGAKAPDVLLVDTTDIATDTNQAGFSLTQRLYVGPRNAKPCPDEPAASPKCSSKPRDR